jgi:hypothetical protein
LAESKGRRLLRVDFSTAGPDAAGAVDTSLKPSSISIYLPATR